MTTAVPAIEVTHHAHPLPIGRPGREQDAIHTIDGHLAGAQKAESLPVPAFTEQMQIIVTDLGRKAVRLILLMFPPILILPGDAKPVREAALGTGPFEYLAVPDPVHWRPDIGNRHRLRARQQAAGNLGGAIAVLAEHHAGVVMSCRIQAGDIITLFRFRVAD